MPLNERNCIITIPNAKSFSMVAIVDMCAGFNVLQELAEIENSVLFQGTAH